MAEHAEESFIKTPQQLITIVVLAFVIPIFGIILLVNYVTGRPKAAPSAMTPEAVTARLAPVGSVEVGAPAAAPGARSGEEIVKAVCAACHLTGAAGAPKTGDKAAWEPRLKQGLPKLMANSISGLRAMPPRGGAGDLTDLELTRAIVNMANQSGGSLKEPAAPAADKKAEAAKK